MDVKYDVDKQIMADFIAFAFRVANLGKGEEEEKYKALIRESEGEKWIESIHHKLSTDELKELQVFFQKDSHIAISLMPYWYSQSALTSIEALLDSIRAVDETQLVEWMVNTSFVDDSVKQLPVEKRIKSLPIPEEEKWKLIYFIQQPNEIKDRLCQLLQHLYDQHYANFESLVSTKIKEKVEHFNNQKYNEFIKEMASQYTNWDGNKKLVVIPSYSMSVGFISFDEADFSLLVVGIERFDLSQKMRDEKEVLELLKILTDERRFNMLRLLKQRAHYGYEIAQELGVSNSTVSHHLAILLNHGFVQSKRDENKVYYAINQDEVKSVIKELEELFLT
ncbi:DNA-binding transcriptional ArsR family regulator [Alkalibacillus filiformis]|uniref:DNA-binding transcriptional ArsR family regulator n=1 Tax=Alkalibacillus filiformis TaxID=200990 RepID=A0ABU0DWU6_9BACI|nr:metalloregulator ArsR/SmtB family transcription factor [Alkalibacillus filiformis]MDQ0352876.1 DNA-binding transcriptional ArsR family regulator [Alkalibacillus filiformis]